jgi:SAM-dependent MidA family methyltransferase
MDEALYGPNGFYRASGTPGAHYRTAAHTSPYRSSAWAKAIADLAERTGGDHVVEIGAGGGELITALAEMLPERWQLTAVDVAPRPVTVPARVEWRDEAPPEFHGLLIAVEWLDVVAVDVVELTDEGLRYVEVAPDGAERLGDPVDEPDAAWLAQWWPVAEPGDRAEIGRTRDEAWAAAVARLTQGVAVAVDYGADPRRDVAGTMTGYRAGRQVMPAPDGSCDITAHVLLESCPAAVPDVQSLLLTQRDALTRLGVSGRRPSYGGDPRAYLSELSAAGEAAELLDPGGLGGFTWLVQAKGVALPL